MSGHSKWATTKHKKAVVDARRGKLFAKLIKNIEVAARTGGGDPAGNPTLADAIAKAKGNSVPNDNIDRAVRRGAGLDAGGADYEAITYEGYGPGGVGAARRVPHRQPQPCGDRGPHRADPQRRHPGRPRQRRLPVRPQGRRAGRRSPRAAPRTTCSARCSTPAPRRSTTSARTSRSICEATDLQAVRAALEAAAIPIESADIAFLPSVSVPLDDDNGRKVLRLVDALEDSDDVQNVWANFDVSDEVLESV